MGVLTGLLAASAHVHAGCATLRRDIELHLADVDEGFVLRLALVLSIGLARLFLSAHLVNLGD